MVHRRYSGRPPAWRVGAATMIFGLTFGLVAPMASAATTAPAEDEIATEVVSAPPAIPVPDSNLDLSGHAYPRQAPVAEVEVNPNDASYDRGAIPFHDLPPMLNEWMEASEYISVEIVGESTQGRPFYLVTVTAPESDAESAQQEAWRDAIKYDPDSAAEDTALAEGYKAPIWFNSNIHGNEWDGTDASVIYIENLIEGLEAGDEEALHLAEKYRLYFSLSNNPDGRVAGTRATALGLDANRDNVTNTTPETAMVRDLASELQPLFFADLHGYTGALQIEPTGPPHGENYEMDLMMPHSYAAALQIEEDFAESGFLEGRDGLNPHPPNEDTPIRIPFRDIRSGWDGWPPIFVAQYVMFQGSISYTVEFGPRREEDPELNQENLQLNAAVGDMIIDSTLNYVDDNLDELIQNQIEIFRRGGAGEPLAEIGPNPDPAEFDGPDQWTTVWNEADVYATEFPRAYVIPAGEAQSSSSDAATLVEMLLSHGVIVEQAETEFTAGDTTYPAGSYIVDMHQPLRGLANVMLADGADISDRVPSMYDISAWSLGRLWGATVDRIGSTSDPALEVASSPVNAASPTGSFPEDAEYVSLSLDGVAEIQALNALLEVEVPVADIGDGTFVVGEEGLLAAASASAVFDVSFAATDGSELLDDNVTAATALTVGYTHNDAGLALDDMGFETVHVASDFSDYESIDVLMVGSELEPTPALEEFISSGGGYVATDSASGATLGSELGVLEADHVASTSGANGIVLVDADEDGVIGATSDPAAFFSGPAYFDNLGDNVAVEQTWGEYLSGHWLAEDSTPGPEDFVGEASAISAEAETGARAFIFATQPVYRTHTRGAYNDVAAALIWAAASDEESPVAPPEGTEPDDEDESTPPEEEATPPAEEETTPPDDDEDEATPPAGDEETVPPAEDGEESAPPAAGEDGTTPPAAGDAARGGDARSDDDGLALTGAIVVPVVLASVALLLVGTALVTRRRGSPRASSQANL